MSRVRRAPVVLAGLLAIGACRPAPDPLACPAPGQDAPWARGVHWVPDDTTHPSWSNDSLRRVLVAMEDTDQGVRHGVMQHLHDSAFMGRMAHVDSIDAARIRAIIQRYGWPTRRLVGAAGAEGAWIIVQHGDTALLDEGLRLMTRAAPGETDPQNVAMLVDRVRVFHGRPQCFGTQLRQGPHDTWVLDSLEDSAHVDARRARLGMEPLADYVRGTTQ